MSIKVKDYKQLYAVLEKRIDYALQIVAGKVEEIIRRYVMDNLYQSYQPDDYWRSYDYVNSLTCGKVTKNGNFHQVEIYFDPNKIRSIEVEDSMWNRHMSVDGNDTWNNKPISEWIPIWIEKGIDKDNGSLWDRKGIEVVKNVTKELEQTKYHLKEISTILRKQGINAQWQR